MVLDTRKRNGKGRNFSVYTNNLHIQHSRYLHIRKWAFLSLFVLFTWALQTCGHSGLSENEVLRLLVLVSPLGIILPSGYGYLYVSLNEKSGIVGKALGLRTLENQECSFDFLLYFL